MISSAWRPIEPVAPRSAIRFTLPSVGSGRQPTAGPVSPDQDRLAEPTGDNISPVIRPAHPRIPKPSPASTSRPGRSPTAGILPQEGLEQLSGDRAARRVELHRQSPPIVAAADDEIVGFASVEPCERRRRRRRAVLDLRPPDFWDRGFGRELIDAAENRLRELDHSHAVLWVLEDNPRARRFYELAGRRSTGQGARSRSSASSFPRSVTERLSRQRPTPEAGSRRRQTRTAVRRAGRARLRARGAIAPNPSPACRA